MIKVYGWEIDGKFYISRFPKPKAGDRPRPVNLYDSQPEAIRDSEDRGVSVEWQQ